MMRFLLLQSAAIQNINQSVTKKSKKKNLGISSASSRKMMHEREMHPLPLKAQSNYGSFSPQAGESFKEHKVELPQRRQFHKYCAENVVTTSYTFQLIEQVFFLQLKCTTKCFSAECHHSSVLWEFK